MDASNDHMNDSEDDEDEDNDHEVKEEPEDKDTNDKQSGDGEKKKRRRGTPAVKEIIAVQFMPKYRSCAKNRRSKITQQSGATDWQLPLYTSQPYPGKPPGKKKRKREDNSRYISLLSFFIFYCISFNCIYF